MNDWVGLYPPSAKLGQLLLIGTHDSGTFAIPRVRLFVSSVRCQTLTFAEQLNHGVRSFDCRLNKNMEFTHGDFKMNTQLRILLGDAVNFFKQYPMELVIFLIKAEGKKGSSAEWTRRFEEETKPFRDYLVIDPKVLDREIGELRGKIIIITRNDNAQEPGYVPNAPAVGFPDNATNWHTRSDGNYVEVAVADRYLAHPATKLQAIAEEWPIAAKIKEMDPTYLILYFLSGFDNPAPYGGVPNPSIWTLQFFKLGGFSRIHDRLTDLRRGMILNVDFVSHWTPVIHEVHKLIKSLN